MNRKDLGRGISYRNAYPLDKHTDSAILLELNKVRKEKEIDQRIQHRQI